MIHMTHNSFVTYSFGTDSALAESESETETETETEIDLH